MATITLSRKVESTSRILRKDPHESLKRFPEVRCSVTCRVCRQRLVCVTVGTASSNIFRVVWTRRIGESNDSGPRIVKKSNYLDLFYLRAWINVAIDWNTIRESNLNKSVSLFGITGYNYPPGLVGLCITYSKHSTTNKDWKRRFHQYPRRKVHSLEIIQSSNYFQGPHWSKLSMVQSLDRCSLLRRTRRRCLE